MSERLKEILDTYEDFELAFLYKYNISAYFEDTQLFIRKYIRNRDLTDEKIQKLIDETSKIIVTAGENKCFRCKSSKIISITEELDSRGRIEVIDGVNNIESPSEKKICSVCGFVLCDINIANDNIPWYKKFLSNLIRSLRVIFRRY